MFTLQTFYKSHEWQKFRDVVISERVKPDGFVYDEVTGKPIVNAYDIILHHTIFLTEENVNDASISLNPDLIQIVSHKTHNYIHNKLGYTKRELYLVYGPPLAGKSTYVSSVMDPGDLIIEIDRIWTCISGMAPEQKPKRLNAVAFKLRDTLLDAARYRIGYWNNCYIVGGYPLISERERLCKELGAREIYIDTDRDTCLARLSTASNLDQEAYKKYIDDWFRKSAAGHPPSGS